MGIRIRPSHCSVSLGWSGSLVVTWIRFENVPVYLFEARRRANFSV